MTPRLGAVHRAHGHREDAHHLQQAPQKPATPIHQPLPHLSARTRPTKPRTPIGQQAGQEAGPLAPPGSPCPPAWLSQLLCPLPSWVGPRCPCTLLLSGILLSPSRHPPLGQVLGYGSLCICLEARLRTARCESQDTQNEKRSSSRGPVILGEAEVSEGLPEVELPSCSPDS